MGALKKILIGTGIAGTVGGAIYLYARRIKKAAENLVVTPTIRLHKIDLKAITLAVEVKIKNPSASQMVIAYPFIKIDYKGATLGSSQPKNENVTLPKFGEPNPPIPVFYVEIPLLGAFSLAVDFLKALQSTDPIAVDVVTTTSLVLGPTRIPYTDVRKITLKKQS